MIGIAAELQARHDKEREGVTHEEARKVAAELDIDPALVEDATRELASRREAAAAAKARTRKTRLALTAVAGALAVLMLGAAAVRGGTIAETRLAEAAAESQLTRVIERQATLTPQFLALSGVHGKDVAPQVEAVRAAPDLTARQAASVALSDALSTELARLPPPATDAEAQLRLNLSYELVGAQNRIAAESGRWEVAHAAREQAESGVIGAVALGLGLD